MPHRNKIWILEDDPGACFVYNEILQANYALRVFPTIAGLKAAQAELEPPNLLIADLAMPDGSFLQQINAPREQKKTHVPILVVSGMDDIDILRSCYKSGIVDYITKPFNRSQLLAKVETVFGHHHRISRPAGLPFIIDYSAGQLRSATGKVIEMTRKEAQILNLLLSKYPEGVTRSEIFPKLWKDMRVTQKVFDVHLSNLRRKLKEVGVVIDMKGKTYQLVTAPQEKTSTQAG